MATDAYASDLGIDGNNDRTISFWMYPENQRVQTTWKLESTALVEGIGLMDQTMEFGRFVDFGTRMATVGFSLLTGDMTLRFFIGEGVKGKWVHVVHQYSSRDILVYVNGILRLNNTKKGMDTRIISHFKLGVGPKKPQVGS